MDAAFDGDVCEARVVHAPDPGLVDDADDAGRARVPRPSEGLDALDPRLARLVDDAADHDDSPRILALEQKRRERRGEILRRPSAHEEDERIRGRRQSEDPGLDGGVLDPAGAEAAAGRVLGPLVREVRADRRRAQHQGATQTLADGR